MATANSEIVPSLVDAIPADQRLRPRIEAAGANVELVGAWTLSALHVDAASIQRELAALSKPETHWDLRGIVALDEFGALLLWRAWNWRLPPSVLLRTEYEARFSKLPAGASPPRTGQRPRPLDTVYAADRMRSHFCSMQPVSRDYWVS